ncbi:methyltransferase domain-containing protein [Salinarimonas soli]|uniref:Methyltransferase domain-containing protein n=2 Tax=Salinarimonas soli TaxID=1638099 RepID=A0A5B2V1Z5_9HYPH|nr:methyltransferase domain-containing protein [Salinarimonas soli]
MALAQSLKSRTSLDDVWEEAARKAALPARDEALARAIAITGFRRFGTIREALRERLTQGLPADERMMALLVTGAAQILFLDVPDHAAVATTVEVARGDRLLLHYAGLVNAVLRRVARERDAIIASADPLADVPPWLQARWGEAYAEATLLALANAHRQEAAVDLTLRQEGGDWPERLGAVRLPTGSLRLTERMGIADLPGFDEGAWWVQDAAAALPARLLRVEAGERVADLCAAPGGKTLQLAAAGARVVAVDRSAKRLERLQANLKRLRLEAEVRVTDVLAMPDETFDAVLLDAPCSATGTLRRHPDVAWLKSDADVTRLADLQTRLLDRAADLTRPGGGRLVFCTCSLEPEEGERQAEAFLARRPDMERVPVEPAEVGGLEALVNARGELRTLPHLMPDMGTGRPGMDGFFAARFRRR